MLDKIKDILIICALESEANNELNKYNVLFTGVGKVNATCELTNYFLTFGIPKMAVNYGTAGSRNLPIGKLVECSRFIQRDIDASPLGFPRGITPFDNTPRLLGPRNEGLIVGSGDSFVKDVTNEMEGIDVFDMEAYALAKICNKFGVPFKCWKYITDNADDKSPNDWLQHQSNGIKKFKDKFNKIYK